MIDLQNYKRPLIIAGAGCLSSYSLLREFVHKACIPVVTSLPAVGIIPTEDYYYYGFIGHAGYPSANKIVGEADLIIALGTRLDMRQTGTETKEFAPNAEIIMVNNDIEECLYPRVDTDLWVMSCENALEDLLNSKISDWSQWTERCDEIVIANPLSKSEIADEIWEINIDYPPDTIFVCGVGTHQMECYRTLTLDYPRRQLLSSYGHGTMGAGLPMALGAALTTGKKVVLIDGDGSFQMSLNELGTWMSLYPRLNLSVHVIDNGNGGIVSQFCELNGCSSTETTWQNPDFEAIGRAYGVKVQVHRTSQKGVWPILENNKKMSEMTYQSNV